MAALLPLALGGVGCEEASSVRDLDSGADSEPPGLLSDLPASSLDPAAAVRGQTLYVPSYSQVLVEAERRLGVTVTLSIHNVDFEHPITLTSVRYYRSEGTLIEEFLKDGPVELKPMQTAMKAVARSDVRGGEGANFVVEWISDQEVNPPLTEAVMVFARGQGFSFTSRGVVIDER
ncbi:MAG: DUF3124 domain-containing protein [Myxococcota bacterium]